MEAQRELGMDGQTLGGLGDKHIGRTSMNSPRPHRACSSPPETGPGSTSAHYIVNCKTKTLVCVQCESLPASHTRGFTEPSGCHLLVWHTGSVAHLFTQPGNHKAHLDGLRAFHPTHSLPWTFKETAEWSFLLSREQCGTVLTQIWFRVRLDRE